MDNKFHKATDGIYRLKIPFDTVYTSVFLVETDIGDILVDCASNARDVDEFIVPALEKMGKNMADIKAIVLTHRHGDHAGGLERILSLCPQIDVITDVRTVCDGICTYPMAGHTKDCIGVLHSRTQTLISGDGLQGAGVDKYRCYTQDREAYIETVKRIESDETITSILFSHAYEPWNKDSVFGRDEVLNCLIKCIECLGDKNESNTCK